MSYLANEAGSGEDTSWPDSVLSLVSHATFNSHQKAIVSCCVFGHLSSTFDQDLVLMVGVSSAMLLFVLCEMELVVVVVPPQVHRAASGPRGL